MISHAPFWLPLWAAWPPHGFQGEGKDLGPARTFRMGQVSSQPPSDPRLLPAHLSIQSHPPTNAMPCQAMCLATGRLPPLWARLGDTLGRGSQASVYTGTAPPPPPRPGPAKDADPLALPQQFMPIHRPRHLHVAQALQGRPKSWGSVWSMKPGRLLETGAKFSVWGGLFQGTYCTTTIA